MPELMLAGRAMKAAMEPLRPLLAAAGAKPAAVVVAGTVKGDLHDIGKNLVISMLEGASFKVIDIGTDVTPQQFVEAIREHQPEILCLSALLTVTMTAMKTTIDAIKEAGLRRSVKILVGGAPLNERYATEIGADGYGATATDAVALARRRWAWRIDMGSAFSPRSYSQLAVASADDLMFGVAPRACAMRFRPRNRRG